MPLIYKTLYEVKLMHEYYLTGADGNTVFGLSEQQQRLDFLQAQFTLGLSSINDSLSFEFPEGLKTFYEGHGLKILPSYSGFRVVVRVNQKTLTDGSLVYQPAVDLPDDLDIRVVILKNNGGVERFSNTRTIRNLPSKYFFSSEGNTVSRTFPYLTSEVSPVKSNYTYEQGELASFGSGDLRYFYRDASGDQWVSVPGIAFANENDLLLLPSAFDFLFGPSATVKNALFTLSTANGDVIKTITINSDSNLVRVPLDFSDKSDLVSIADDKAATASTLQLEVKGEGYLKSFPLLISDAVYSAIVWGLISIPVRTSVEAFRLLTNEGYLKKKRDPLGAWDSPPVFEIPVNSRQPFWRFRNNRGRELKLTNDLNDFLQKEDKILITRQPVAVTRNYFLLQNQWNTVTKYLPNPTDYDLKMDEEQRWCFDIMVPQSELFPVI